MTLIERVTVADGREIPDAATGEIIGRTARHTVADLERMYQAARRAQKGWAALSQERRDAYLLALADAIDAEAEQLAVLLSREQGKPLEGPNARFEIGACSAWLRATAATSVPSEVLVDEPGNRSELIYKPVGVVAAIGPWNWPLMIMIWQVAPSLKMGNSVVVKPSEYTPLSVQALVAVMNDVLPEDVLHVISGDREVGAAMASHPGFDKIMFTGSTATGKAIIKSSADNLTRLTLELGGNDAGIVLPGTDIATHADDLFWGAFLNTGQTCAALKRLYVHESQYEEVVDELAKRAAATPMGVGLDAGNVLGPLQNRRQFDIVKRLVDDARDRGARIAAGGSPAPELGPTFFQATIVADIEDGAPLVDEEQFGPALPVIKYTDVSDAIARANALDAALGASVWGDDPDAARQVALQLEAGTVWINAHGGIHPMVPFGGIKGSGYGLEFGVEGLKSVAVPMVITTA
ncbi:MAG: aldehyde dehydrogenase family protein [Microbacterium sp.]|uniref:aldehyde dehydrogenase family protein n=1 Tax=Microbacterium sp. TaxID=51671 RepID=UPI00262CDA93|nr:aldehyde dehydrogenase family protein [Microbacterium sp.]MCX6501484.1 aldehyde dehydrogenase family protein [Microbacterium sp.]